MAVRREYSDLEKEILANFEKEADMRQGWFRLPLDAPPFMKGNPFTTAKTLAGVCLNPKAAQIQARAAQVLGR